MCTECSSPTDNSANTNKRKRSSDFSISRLTESTPKRPSESSPRSLVDDFSRDRITSPNFERSPPFYSSRFLPFPGQSALSPIQPHHGMLPSRLPHGLSPLSNRQSVPLTSTAEQMKLFSFPCEQFPVDSRIFGNDVMAQRQASYWSNVMAHGY